MTEPDTKDDIQINMENILRDCGISSQEDFIRFFSGQGQSIPCQESAEKGKASDKSEK